MSDEPQSTHEVVTSDMFEGTPAKLPPMMPTDIAASTPDEIWMVAYNHTYADGLICEGIYETWFRSKEAAEAFVNNYARSAWDRMTSIAGETLRTQNYTYVKYAKPPF